MTQRQYLVAGNWKMNGSLVDNDALVDITGCAKLEQPRGIMILANASLETLTGLEAVQRSACGIAICRYAVRCRRLGAEDSPRAGSRRGQPDRRLGSGSGRPDRVPDAGGRCGHVEMAHAERRQRVHHGVHDGGGGCDGAGLTASLDAKPVGAAWKIRRQAAFERGKIAGTRQPVPVRRDDEHRGGQNRDKNRNRRRRGFRRARRARSCAGTGG